MKDGEKVLSAKTQSTLQPPTPLTVQTREESTDLYPDQIAIDSMNADEVLIKASSNLLAPLFAEVRDGLTPAELLVRLGDLYPRMDSAELQDLMARAIMLATIMGEASATGEVDGNA